MEQVDNTARIRLTAVVVAASSLSGAGEVFSQECIQRPMPIKSSWQVPGGLMDWLQGLPCWNHPFYAKFDLFLLGAVHDRSRINSTVTVTTISTWITLHFEDIATGVW